MESVPITVIAGYLGAGKTTLINNALSQLDDAAGLALLVNDFGELNIDAALLRGAMEDDRIMSLQNGCICCALRDDLAQSLEALRDRGVDRIWMEASGVALPRKTKRQCDYPGYRATHALVVVDGRDYQTLSTDKYVGKLVRQQCAEADAVVYTKNRDAPTAAWANPDDRPVVWCDDPRVPGLLAPRDPLGATIDPAKETTRFASMKLDGRSWKDQRELREFLRGLPDFVFRAKGFVALGDAVYLVQKAGEDIVLTPCQASELGLVLIYPEHLTGSPELLAARALAPAR